jgi:hypothetical protein
MNAAEYPAPANTSYLLKIQKKNVLQMANSYFVYVDRCFQSSFNLQIDKIQPTLRHASHVAKKMNTSSGHIMLKEKTFLNRLN